MRAPTLPFLVLLSLTVASLASAHSPPGTPKTYCQSVVDMYQHDYAGGSQPRKPWLTQTLEASAQDGNLEECSTPTYGLFLFTEDDCATTLAPLVGTPVYALACQTDRPADWDGEYDWAVGGAILAIYTAPGRSAPCQSPDADGRCSPGGTFAISRGGSQDCWGMAAHHPEGATVYVQDAALLGGVGLVVGSDWRRAAFDGTGLFECGDDILEPCDAAEPIDIDQVTCNSRDRVDASTPKIGMASNSAVAPGVAGQDGTYRVVVVGGTAGHIWT